MSSKKILASKEQPIQVVHFDSTFNILNTQNSAIDIVFQNITYSVQIPDESQNSIIPCKKVFKEKTILKNVSGIFKAGHSTAIMGASGAGKTTLLNILACRIQHKQGGKLYANNFQYQYENFGDFANYVMQNDLLMQTMTVRQTLLFAAELKMNADKQTQRQRVNQLAHQLKLQKCMDTLVGGVLLKGISGGERKRVSIAFELISDPQVLFLDEPTSGLDSLTSYIIVSELNKLAKRENKTIIMTIHQPNSQVYAIFDNLLLLLEGRIIYQGKASQITNYFEKNFNLTCPEFMNPPDFFMSKIHFEDQKNRQYYPRYFEAYQKNQGQEIRKKIMNKQTSQIQSRVSLISFWTAIPPLINRNVINMIRNPMLLKSKFFQGIFIALFVGGLYFGIGKNDYTNINYWNSITGFLFFLTISGMMSFLSPISLTFPSQKQVFFKEQDSRMYGVGQYFLSRNLVQIPELVLIPLMIVSIYYFMVGMAPTAQQFFLHYIIYLLSAFAGSSLGLFIGSVIIDEKSISAVIPLVLLPIILFSGFFKNRANLPVWIGWVQYISPNKYGFIAHISNQTSYKASMISALNLDLNKSQAIGILFALGVSLRFLSMFFLWYTKKKTQ